MTNYRSFIRVNRIPRDRYYPLAYLLIQLAPVKCLHCSEFIVIIAIVVDSHEKFNFHNEVNICRIHHSNTVSLNSQISLEFNKMLLRALTRLQFLRGGAKDAV